MRLHLPAVPHTVTRADFSHCAFTQKVRNFSPMLREQGYEVIHYGVAGSESGATEDVVLMEKDEHLALMELPDYHSSPSRLIGDLGRTDSAVYRQFNYSFRQELRERLEPGDVLCVPWGGGGVDPYAPAYSDHPLVTSRQVAVVETGIGYPRPRSHLRVYESEAWRHWNMGAESREGMEANTSRLEWVVPNYYRPEEWPFCGDMTRGVVVYLGRIEEVKGMSLLVELANQNPKTQFVICGQGNPEPYLQQAGNIAYKPPIRGKERVAYLSQAQAVICPSRFVEPFCGVAVEAMLVGTPVITSNFGAFTETVVQGVTGYRCQGWRQWNAALEKVTCLPRGVVATSARSRYLMSMVGPKYAQVFEDVAQWITTHKLQ